MDIDESGGLSGSRMLSSWTGSGRCFIFEDHRFTGFLAKCLDSIFSQQISKHFICDVQPLSKTMAASWPSDHHSSPQRVVHHHTSRNRNKPRLAVQSLSWKMHHRPKPLNIGEYITNSLLSSQLRATTC